MVTPRILSAAATLTFLLTSTPQQTNACSCLDVSYTPCDFVQGIAPPKATDVVRATALRSSPAPTDISDDFAFVEVVYTVKVVEVFKGDASCGQEISFVTDDPALCGIMLQIGVEYALALSPSSSGQLAIGYCGLYRRWDDIPDEEMAPLEARCVDDDPCAGTCGEFQECAKYDKNGKYYCSDTCDGNPCGDGTRCRTRPKRWCRKTDFGGCPRKRRCLAH